MRRKDFVDEVEKESRRLKASRNNKKGMWHYLASAASIGWLVVIPAFGGAYLGRYLDRRWGTGGYWTLSLMLAGLIAGIFWIWHSNLGRGGKRK
jgi:ATP synthase protein I